MVQLRPYVPYWALAVALITQGARADGRPGPSSSGEPESRVRRPEGPPFELDLTLESPAVRNLLLRKLQGGIVAVRFLPRAEGTVFEVLEECTGSEGAYSYASSSRGRLPPPNPSAGSGPSALRSPRLRIETRWGEDGARTDSTIVGRYVVSSEGQGLGSRLHGADCARATHVVGTMAVGAYVRATGPLEVLEEPLPLMAPGKDKKGIPLLQLQGETHEGDPVACGLSLEQRKSVPSCTVPLRLGLVPMDLREKPRLKPTVASSNTPPGRLCDTPYYVDAEGVQRFRRACLEEPTGASPASGSPSEVEATGAARVVSPEGAPPSARPSLRPPKPCDRPYYQDERGIQRLRRECL